MTQRVNQQTITGESYRFLHDVLEEALRHGQSQPRKLDAHFHLQNAQGDTEVPILLEAMAFDDRKNPQKKGDIILRLGLHEGIETGLHEPSLDELAQKAGLKKLDERSFTGGDQIRGFGVQPGYYVCDNPSHKTGVFITKEEGKSHRQTLCFNPADSGKILSALRELYVHSQLRPTTRDNNSHMRY